MQTTRTSVSVSSATTNSETKRLSCRICSGAALVPAGEVRGYRFVRCTSCEFIVCPDLTAESIGSTYERPMDEVPEGGWASADFLEPAFAHVGEGPLDIFDFGTGESRVPQLLRQRGHRVIALDTCAPPPETAHPDRLTGDIFELQFPSNAFDIVYAFQVLEHLPEPVPIFEELLRLVRPGGVLVIHTDMHVPERSDDLKSWWYVMPPTHCAFYTHRTFEVLLRARSHALVWRDAKSVMVEKRN